MKAMILAAGLGKRLLPLTKNMSKVLLQAGQKSLIEFDRTIFIKKTNEIIEKPKTKKYTFLIRVFKFILFKINNPKK